MSRRATRLQRRRRILEAARAVFVRSGYGAARMSDIATAAKVGKGTLYEYFASKDDLFSTLVLVTMRESLETLSGVSGLSEDPVEALREAIATIVKAALVENLDLYRLFFDFWGIEAARRRRDQGQLREVEASFRAFVEELVRQGQRAGRFRPEVDPAQCARILGAAVDGMSMRLVILGEQVDLDAYTVGLQDLLIGGLTAGGRLDGASILP